MLILTLTLMLTLMPMFVPVAVLFWGGCIIGLALCSQNRRTPSYYIGPSPK